MNFLSAPAVLLCVGMHMCSITFEVEMIDPKKASSTVGIRPTFKCAREFQPQKKILEAAACKNCLHNVYPDLLFIPRRILAN